MVIWSTNSTRSAVGNPVVQLLESGNLVLKDDSASYIWQSFDYPTDTRLPGMKLGLDLKNGFSRNLTSWKNADDPSLGDYSYVMDITGLPQFVLLNASTKQFRSGVWNGVLYTGLVGFKLLDIFRNINDINADEVTSSFGGNHSSVITRELLNEQGKLQRFRWDKQTMKWIEMLVLPRDKCDDYNHCGINSICNIASTPTCQYLQGFTAISSQQRSINNWIDGCVRKKKSRVCKRYICTN